MVELSATVERRRSEWAWRPVLAVAGGITLLLIALSGRYDYHRDELYFRLLGQHPQWGYVDQPPFTPLLARLSIEIFGDHLWAIRIVPAVLAGVAAVLVAAIAREFGGRAVAQTLAAIGAAGTLPLAGAHVGSTANTDTVVWLGILLCAVRAVVHGQQRAWLVAGVITGLGLYNKLLVVLLLICLAGGLLIAGPRRELASKWLWAGAALALVIGLPNLIYQVTHDFPQSHMAAAIAEDKGTESRIMLLPIQLVIIGVPLLPVLVAGIIGAYRRFRALVVAYGLMLILTFATGGQPYYTTGLVLTLFAIGAVSAETWRWRRTLGVVVAVNLVFAVVFALPVLPADKLGPITDINIVMADQIGWPEYVSQVEQALATLTPDERARAVVFTGNYGEAGALDRYGVRDVYSGHNELGYFPPPPDSKTIAVVLSQAPPDRVNATFGGCDQVGQLSNSAGVGNEETEAFLYVCKQLPAPWSQMWPELRHFG
ncbi:glycosyltransferase family 39 protein [Actinoplanes bogorensis]|uniref:Glycosyltransferase family 39 protein n=1 Tax=Paractinoplanes bogorensis TaxID=1610840 RepID=A0ABS5YYB3_9ACTN|nr:glycosyltransferase family 39 protein [Actinoplanes bogorensis]MBU2668432.1 glycosyltransferase family 39 protein [Actinoplanes bogorensis]